MKNVSSTPLDGFIKNTSNESIDNYTETDSYKPSDDFTKKASGKLYGIGVGPGDPELLTLKAVRLIRSCRWVALPDSGSESAVLRIVKDYLEETNLFFVDMPMTKDEATLTAAHDAAFAAVCEKLAEGDVAFLTLGDPSLYSTFSPLQRRAKAAGVACEAVPGVPSFLAAAALLNAPLSEGDETLTICTANAPVPNGNAIIMKAKGKYESLRTALEESGRLENAALVEKCGMQGERIAKVSDSTPDSYFCLVIVK